MNVVVVYDSLDDGARWLAEAISFNLLVDGVANIGLITRFLYPAMEPSALINIGMTGEITYYDYQLYPVSGVIMDRAIHVKANEFSTVDLPDWFLSISEQIVCVAPAAPETKTVLRKQQVFKRDAAVKQITVTTSSGKVFDGDEDSQNRMCRAVTFGSPGQTTTWKMANNLEETVTWEELKEAGGLCGLAQTPIWME